jgi:hypothetical protein
VGTGIAHYVSRMRGAPKATAPRHARGTLYPHCDPHGSRYLTPILDDIFGMQNFRNDVIWERTGSAPLYWNTQTLTLCDETAPWCASGFQSPGSLTPDRLCTSIESWPHDWQELAGRA